jgi:GNAT superfamily N-acetyltransferase
MARRVARLTLDNLPDLAGSCASCVFWQLDPVSRGRAAGHECDELSAWLSEVLREWGSCGRVLYVDDQPAGHVLYAPAVHVPGADQLPTAPVSPDAVLLVSLRVEPAYAGGGLGRVLVQSMAKDLIKRGGIRAVEAFGRADLRADHRADHRADLRAGPATGDGDRQFCVLPADFLLGVGFRTHRAHERYPRMRMDLRSVLTWRGELEAALDRLLAAGRRAGPVRAPATPPTVPTRASRGAQRGAERGARTGAERGAALSTPAPRPGIRPEGSARPL